MIEDAKLHALIREHQAGNCELHLGTDFAHAIGVGTADTSEAARSRMDRLSRGERTLDVYRNGKPSELLIATREQARRLVAFGVKPAAIDREDAELEAAANELAES